MQPRSPWDPGDVIDGFRLGRRLARGGMADLFLATPVDGGDPLVLKSVREDFLHRDEIVRMFEREAALVTQLDHPNIVRVHRVRVDEVESYIAMEFIDGRDLRDVIRAAATKKSHIPLGVAVRIGLDLLAGLESAHGTKTPDGALLRLVHRDVSPSNIMLTRDGVLKLVDFGIAKQRLATPTSSHVGAKGKGSYMAPEQCRGEALDARVDLYATAAVLYELLTLRRPFDGANSMAVLHAILEGDKRAPSKLRADLPVALERVILRGLERNRDERYPSAATMREALKDAAAESGLDIASPEDVAAVVQTYEPSPQPTLERSLSRLLADGVNHSEPVERRLESSDKTRQETVCDEDFAPVVAPRWGARAALAAGVFVSCVAVLLLSRQPSAKAPRPGHLAAPPVPSAKMVDVSVPAAAVGSEPEVSPLELSPSRVAPAPALPPVEPRPRKRRRRVSDAEREPPAKPKRLRLDEDLRPPNL